MSILNMLRGIGGEYEVQRVLGALGTSVYTLAVPAFVAFGTVKDVSITEFCLAYPAGLAACIGATAGAIRLKDQGVANAKVTEQSGAIPAAPPAGPPANPAMLDATATGESR